MEYEIKKRVLRCANEYLFNHSTVREVAKVIGCSKSTVHNDLTYRLKKIDPLLYKEVLELIDYNKNIRHIRGGEATRNRYHKTTEE